MSQRDEKQRSWEVSKTELAGKILIYPFLSHTERAISRNNQSSFTSHFLFSPFFQRTSSSISPAGSAADRSRSPDAKKMKKEETSEDGAAAAAEKGADEDLVVDDANDSAPANGNRSPKENGATNGDSGSKKDPMSPSSQRSTPGSKKDGAESSKSGASPRAKMSPPVSKALVGLGAGYPFGEAGAAAAAAAAAGLPPPGVFNGFRPPLAGPLVDPSRPLPPGLVGGKP